MLNFKIQVNKIEQVEMSVSCEYNHWVKFEC